MIKIAPSILAAQFGNLEKVVRSMEKGGADWVHLDVMDGHFVPNITFGPVVIRSLRKLTTLPLDAHLMIEDPDLYLQDFKNAGCDHITVHVEACTHLHRTVQRIREMGMTPGVSLNPATCTAALREIVPYVDLVLVMSVNPGFAGQQFIPSMLQKIHEVSDLIGELHPEALLQVDGGVNHSNSRSIVHAGAQVLVAGNSVFSKRDVAGAIRTLRRAAAKG